MTQRRQHLRSEGEAYAARYLESRGYQIVARNVRASRVEIDLIARSQSELVFVERSKRAVRRRTMDLARTCAPPKSANNIESVEAPSRASGSTPN